MEQKEIIKGNVAIAEFMAYSEGFPHRTDLYGYHQVVEGYEVPIVKMDAHREDMNPFQWPSDEMQFHASWSWLMPVFLKVGTMWHWQIEKFGCTIGTPGKAIEYRHAKGDSNNEDSLKMCCWLAIIDFIKWHNATHPQPHNHDQPE